MGHIDSTFMGKYWLVINIQPYYLPATGNGYEFALIRTRTTLPASFFLLFYAATPFLHTWNVTLLLQYSFFVCYIHCFKAMNLPMLRPPYSMLSCGWGLSSLILPCIAWITPLLYIHMINLRSLEGKTLFCRNHWLYITLLASVGGMCASFLLDMC